MTRDAEKCAHCGHVEVDHDGYGGMCDGLGFNHAREVCGCKGFVAPSPAPSEPPIGAVLAEALGAERVVLGSTPEEVDAARDALAAMPEPDPSTVKVIDLMAALKASLRAHADGDVRSHPDRVDGRPQDEGQS